MRVNTRRNDLHHLYELINLLSSYEISDLHLWELSKMTPYDCDFPYLSPQEVHVLKSTFLLKVCEKF